MGWSTGVTSDSIVVHNSKFYGGGNALHNEEYWSFRPVVFNNNTLVECGIYDYGYSAYKQIEGNWLRGFVTNKMLYTRTWQPEGLQLCEPHILVRNNTIDKGYIQIQAEGSQDQNLTAGQHQGVFVAVENNTLKAHHGPLKSR